MMNKIKYLGLLLMVVLVSSCDLGLQETFDFQPEVDLTDPHGNKTAWEYIQSANKLSEDGTFDGEMFNFLAAAIQKANMVDLFNQTSTSNRTYLLLNNNAFTGRGDVIDIITGSQSTSITEDVNGVPTTRQATAEEVMERVDTPEKLEKLKNILKYHIVTSYVQQVPTLFEAEVWYTFQTLIPGEDGLIAFLRENRWRIFVNGKNRTNTPASPLPETAFNEYEAVRSHNYVFNNGVGHILADPVRNKPY
ncbi:hypothetical protein [Polaribacter butkevichii]|nr:hypothetical protein [Polaribacter butkevichii]